MKCESIKLKTTYENGRVAITDHRVWDKERFIKARDDAGLKEYQRHDGSGYRCEEVKS